MITYPALYPLLNGQSIDCVLFSFILLFIKANKIITAKYGCRFASIRKLAKLPKKIIEHDEKENRKQEVWDTSSSSASDIVYLRVSLTINNSKLLVHSDRIANSICL